MLPNQVVNVALVLGLGLTQAACGPGCEHSCVDGSSVVFEPALTERGEYRLHVTASDGLDAECLLTVPATSEQLDCGLGVWAGPLPSDVAQVRSFSLAGTPTNIDVLLERDGKVLADASLTPEYETISTCSRSCDVATTPLSVVTD